MLAERFLNKVEVENWIETEYVGVMVTKREVGIDKLMFWNYVLEFIKFAITNHNVYIQFRKRIEFTIRQISHEYRELKIIYIL